MIYALIVYLVLLIYIVILHNKITKLEKDVKALQERTRYIV